MSLQSRRQRLTDHTIRTLRTMRGEKYRQRFDTIAPGLVFRVTRNGAKNFYFYRMPKASGKRTDPQWLRLGDATALSLADARTEAATRSCSSCRRRGLR